MNCNLSYQASNSGLRAFTPSLSMRRGSTPVGAFDVPALDDNEEEDDYKPRHQVKPSVDSNKDQSNIIPTG